MALAVASGLALVIVMPAGTPGGAAVAAAQEPGDRPTEPGVDTTPRVRLALTGLSGVLGPGSVQPDDDAPTDLDLRLVVENTGSVDLTDLQVVVEVMSSFGGARSLLHQTLDSQSARGQLRSLRRIDVRDGGALRAGAFTGVAVTIPGPEIGWGGSNDAYPVQVSVVLGTQVLDRVVTGVVHLVDPPDRPLRTTVVWPLEAASDRLPTGVYREAIPQDLAPGGRLDQRLRALERHPDAAVLLAPDAATVEELADRANGFELADGTVVADDDPAALQAADLLERLRAAVARSPLDPVVGSYGHVDISALVGASSSVLPLADLAVDLARTRTQALLGRAPDLQVHLANTPLSEDSLSILGADHLLLPWTQVEGPDLSNHPNIPAPGRQLVGIRGQRGPRTATVADPHVTAVLTAPPTDAGRAVTHQRLVAETAMLYLAEPGRAGRTLLVLPPPQWDPPDGTIGVLLDALVSTPWLELGPPRVQVDEPGTLRPNQQPMSSTLVDEVLTTLRRLDALQEAMPEGTTALGPQSIADLQDATLRSLTVEALSDDGRGARASLRAVRQVVDEAFGEVRLAAGTRVTLTSDTGEIPVTIERTTGDAIDVVVEVRSSNALRWSDDTRIQRISLGPGTTRTLSFSTRAMSRGTFPVTVSVWDPTRETLLDTTVLSVRSTAISRTALVAIGGVVLVLLLIGALRRRRSPRLEVVR